KLIEKAKKAADHSNGKGNDNNGDPGNGHGNSGHAHDGGGNTGGGDSDDDGGGGTISSGGSGGPHVIVTPPSSPGAGPTVHPATPPKVPPATALPILALAADTEDVSLSGSPAVHLHEHLQFVSTDALHGPTLSVGPLDLATVTTMGSGLRVAAESEPEEFQPI